MRSVKTKTPARPARARQTIAGAAKTNDHAEELMALAVDAAQSRHLPDFLKHFAERSAHMLGALWGGVAVFRGRETELFAGKNAACGQLDVRQSEWLFACARENRGGFEVRGLDALQAGWFPRSGEELAA